MPTAYSLIREANSFAKKGYMLNDQSPCGKKTVGGTKKNDLQNLNLPSRHLFVQSKQ